MKIYNKKKLKCLFSRFSADFVAIRGFSRFFAVVLRFAVFHGFSRFFAVAGTLWFGKKIGPKGVKNRPKKALFVRKNGFFEFSRKVH